MFRCNLSYYPLKAARREVAMILLDTHKSEIIHCNLNSINVFNLTSGGGVSLCGPYPLKAARREVDIK